MILVGEMMFFPVQTYPQWLISGGWAWGAIEIDPDGVVHLFFQIYGGFFGEIEVFLLHAALAVLPTQHLCVCLHFLLILDGLLPAGVDHDDVVTAESAFLVDGRPFLVELDDSLGVVEGISVLDDLLWVSFISSTAQRRGGIFVGRV